MNSKAIKDNPLQIALKCSFRSAIANQSQMHIPIEVFTGLAGNVLYLNCSSLDISNIISVRKFLETPVAKSDIRTLIFCSQLPPPKIKTQDIHSTSKLAMKKAKEMTKYDRLEVLMQTKKSKIAESINSPLTLMNELLGMIVEFISTSSSLHSVIFESLHLLEGISDAGTPIQTHFEALPSAIHHEQNSIATLTSSPNVSAVDAKPLHFTKKQGSPIISEAKKVHDNNKVPHAPGMLQSVEAPSSKSRSPMNRIMTAPLDMNSTVATLILLEHFGDALLLFKSVKWLCFRNCPLGDQTFRRLVPSLVKLPLQVMMFESCHLTDNSCKYIASVVKANESRMEVELWNQTLRASSQELSGKYVWNDKNRIHSTGLIAVSLKGNSITDKGLDLLAPYLVDNHWLLGLKLSNNQIQERSIITFIANMSVSCGLQVVLFDGNVGYSRGVGQDIVGKLAEINADKNEQFRTTSYRPTNIRNFNSGSVSISGSGSKSIILIHNNRTGDGINSPDTATCLSFEKHVNVPNSAFLEGDEWNQSSRSGDYSAVACLNAALPKCVYILLQRWKQKLQNYDASNHEMYSPMAMATRQFGIDSRTFEMRPSMASDTSATAVSQQSNDSDTNKAVIAPLATRAAMPTPPVKVVIASLAANKHHQSFLSHLPPPAIPSSSSSSTISSDQIDDAQQAKHLPSQVLTKCVITKQKTSPNNVPNISGHRSRMTTPDSGVSWSVRSGVSDSQRTSSGRNPNMLMRSTASYPSATARTRLALTPPTVSSFHEVIPSRKRIEVSRSVVREPGHIRNFLPTTLDRLNTSPGSGTHISRLSSSSAAVTKPKQMKVTKKSQKTKRTKKQTVAAAQNKRNSKKKTSSAAVGGYNVYSNYASYGNTARASPATSTSSRNSPNFPTAVTPSFGRSAPLDDLLITPSEMVKLTDSLEATSLRLRNICLTVSDTIKLNSYLQKDILLQQQQAEVAKTKESMSSSRVVHQQSLNYSSSHQVSSDALNRTNGMSVAAKCLSGDEYRDLRSGDFSNIVGDSYVRGYDDINSSLQQLAEVYSHLSPLKNQASLIAQNLYFLNQAQAQVHDPYELTRALDSDVVSSAMNNYSHIKTCGQSHFSSVDITAATATAGTASSTGEGTNSLPHRDTNQQAAFSQHQQPVSSRYGSMRDLSDDDEYEEEEDRTRQRQTDQRWVALNSGNSRQYQQTLTDSHQSLNSTTGSQYQQPTQPIIHKQNQELEVQENEEMMKVALTKALRKKISETLKSIDS